MREWLVGIRKKKGISQYKAAEMCGISQSYYAAIETGARGVKLPVPMAKKIGMALGFEWERFYDEGPKAAGE